MSTIKSILQSALVEGFKNSGSYHRYYEFHVDAACSDLEKKGYSIECEEVSEGEWTDEGRYQNVEDAVMKITVDSEVFYLEVSQSRSSCGGGDYFYNEPDVQCLMTEAEYNAPEFVTDFVFNGYTIKIMSDKSAKVDSHSFRSVQEAIEAIR